MIIEAFSFDQLIDLCGVDYLYYGEYDWETDSATENGFSRGVERQEARAMSWINHVLLWFIICFY